MPSTGAVQATKHMRVDFLDLSGAWPQLQHRRFECDIFIHPASAPHYAKVFAESILGPKAKPEHFPQ